MVFFSKFDSCIAILCLVMIGVIIIYLPGLSGGFLLDDHSTLGPMAQWGVINSIEKAFEFIFGGFAGPTGRPVVLFSFLLNAQSWPASPYAFLVTNVLIHCLNALLIFIVLRRIFQKANIESGRWLALIASMFWVLQVSQVSTVLYVVQRMAMLALTFNLVAIYFYLQLREAWLQSNIKYFLVFFFVFLCSAVLAVCSKENAALLPLKLLLIEFLLKSASGLSYARLTFFRWVVVYIPSFLVLAYLVRYLPAYLLTEVNSTRGFTPWQRQLTEFRVLWDYISLFFIPKIQTSGVFHDGYVLSASLLKPVSTLYSLIFHCVVLIGAWVGRKRWPLVFFGIYWFYMNHLIESSVIQLELKFEHRNYEPSIGLALIWTVLLTYLPIAKKLKAFVVLFVCVILAMGTYSRASLWGEPEKAALVWVEENPASVRAIEQAILVHQGIPGREELINSLYDRGMSLSENRIMISLKALNYRCNQLSRPEAAAWIKKIAKQLINSEVEWQIGGVFKKMLDDISGGVCSTITKVQYQFLIESAISNPKYKRTQIPLQLRLLSTLAELRMGDVNKAVEQYQSENYIELPLSLVMTHALWLAVEGQQGAAADILSRSIAQSRQAEGYLKEQAQEMLKKIQNDIRQSYES